MSNARIFLYFKTSPEIIRLAVMLYIRFPLSLRNVEDLLHERGIDITHEAVRFWWKRFGAIFAAEIRRSRVQAMRSFRHRLTDIIRDRLAEFFVGGVTARTAADLLGVTRQTATYFCHRLRESIAAQIEATWTVPKKTSHFSEILIQCPHWDRGMLQDAGPAGVFRYRRTFEALERPWQSTRSLRRSR